MALREIVRLGHPALSQPARPVDDPGSEEVACLVSDMMETLEASGGVGLAAPQVGVGLRLVMFFVPASRAGGEAVPLTVLINPLIEPVGDEIEESFEACLSLPGLTGRVPRWARIRYRGIGLDGALIDREVDGFHARVVQHECDHLDGMVYLNRMNGLNSLAYVEELLRARQAAQPQETTA